MRKTIIILLTILSLVACQSKDENKNVIIDNKYSVSIPSFLKKTNNLNYDASLQYQHLRKEFYVIVIDEPIEDLYAVLQENNLMELYGGGVKGFSKLFLDSAEEDVYISYKSEATDTIINGMPSQLFTINGRTEGVDVFCSLGFIQGRDRYYQIMAWTLSSKEYSYKDKMNDIMYSFKEI